MANSLNEKLRFEVERYRNKDFIKAVLAVCALTASADPTTSPATRHRVESVLDRLDRTGCFSREKSDAILEGYFFAIEGDMDRARRMLHNKVHRFAGDYKRLRTLLRIAYVVVVADGVITPDEQDEFDRLCYLLSIEPGAIIGGLQAGPA